MTEKKPTPPPGPVRRSSGNSPAVKEMRAKQESIADHTIPELDRLNDFLDEAISSVKSNAPPPPAPSRDPRREPSDDDRVDDEVIEEKVVLPPTPRIPSAPEKK